MSWQSSLNTCLVCGSESFSVEERTVKNGLASARENHLGSGDTAQIVQVNTIVFRCKHCGYIKFLMDETDCQMNLIVACG